MKRDNLPELQESQNACLELQVYLRLAVMLLFNFNNNKFIYIFFLKLI